MRIHSVADYLAVNVDVKKPKQWFVSETEAVAKQNHTANTLKCVLVGLVCMLSIALCDKQRGVSCTGPCGDKQAGNPWISRKDNQRAKRCHQEQQAGAGADGAVAVVTLTAAYFSLDGRFDVGISIFWANLLGGAAFQHWLFPFFSHWERMGTRLVAGPCVPTAIIDLSPTWIGKAVILFALAVQGSSAFWTMAVVTFFPIGDQLAWLCRTDIIHHFPPFFNQSWKLS